MSTIRRFRIFTPNTVIPALAEMTEVGVEL